MQENQQMQTILKEEKQEESQNISKNFLFDISWFTVEPGNKFQYLLFDGSIR